MKVDFEKKYNTFRSEISVSSTIQECDNVTTILFNFRSIICQVVLYGRLKTKENVKLLALKVAAVAYERWSLTRGSEYSDLTWKLLVFWKTAR